MKTLVINADDFGLCDSVNSGILECYRNGLVSDFSFIINPDFYIQSIERLKKEKIVEFGIHFNVTLGKSISGLPSCLTDNEGKYYSTKQHFFNYLFGKINVEEVYKELESQLNIFISNGFIITHFDTHQNVHLIPPIFDAITKLKNKYNPKVIIRLPSETIFFPHKYKLTNVLRIFIFNILTAFLKRKFKLKSLVQAIGGDFFNNKNNEKVVPQVIKNILKSKSNVFEMAVHPGYYSDKILDYDTYAIQREWELKYLSKPNDIFNKHSIIISNFSKALN